ncbi:MAG: cobalt ECF transporter T component CbiQ [bacterium]
MDIEQFSQGTSFLHRFDPRLKIIIAVIFSIIIAVAHQYDVILLGFAFSVVLILISQLNFKAIMKRLFIINTFILILWLFLPFTMPGTSVAFSLGPLKATTAGIHYALKITLKSNAILIATIALLSTSTIFTLVHAMSHLYIPLKLIHLFFFCFRYIHVIHLEYIKLRNAIKIRCFKPGTNIHTYKTYAYLIGMLLLKSYDRSKNIYNAMLCRGFKGKYYLFDHFSLKKSDIISSILIFSFLILLIVI